MTSNEIEILYSQTLEKTKTLSSLYEDRKAKVSELLSKPLPAKTLDVELKSLCSNRIDLDFYSFINSTFSFLKLKYKYCNIPFSSIYTTKPGVILNGSFERTKFHLLYAMKFQTLANWAELEGLSSLDIQKVICFYGLKLLNNVNNNCTYNEQSIVYDPITPAYISNFAIQIYEDIYVNHNYTVQDINFQEKTLKFKFEYMKQKRFNKEDLEKLILTFDKKPTIKELTDKYNNSIRANYTNKTNDEIFELMKTLISTTLMRKYIKMFNLEDLIDVKSYNK